MRFIKFPYGCASRAPLQYVRMSGFNKSPTPPSPCTQRAIVRCVGNPRRASARIVARRITTIIPAEYMRRCTGAVQRIHKYIRTCMIDVHCAALLFLLFGTNIHILSIASVYNSHIPHRVFLQSGNIWRSIIGTAGVLSPASAVMYTPFERSMLSCKYNGLLVYLVITSFPFARRRTIYAYCIVVPWLRRNVAG